ncbi:ROK family transcriptional regulator [Paenibacillus sp. CGMCC 1.16610]|uniref:ROK family protein n=1 Tax=Paenibacillus anseongense TaxID=2682845 RepID=A0ABW9UC24_9BACL|nr:MULTISPECIES: ROK family transcriptional regulator [Paenibacillus]MBA2942571.1 ROK family transcriptional regulator [Paenibacillus sp. CGMCC 1.16610]MVQ35385.1 ROK family protein [Paenibacillus anseongense]
MKEDYNSFRWMKLQNKKKVLELLHQEKLISRIDIARRANLQKMTVTNIVNELLAEELVIEEDVLAISGVGRKPVLLRLNREKLYAVGIEVTKSYIIGLVMSYNREIVYQEKVYLVGTSASDVTPCQGDALTKRLEKLIDALLERVPAFARNLGICVGIQGIIDSQKGEVVHSPYLGWFQFGIKEHLTRRYAIPVYIDNNVRAFARGEVWMRTEEQLRHALCIYLDEGIGSALVMNGEIYTGDGYYAGEIGHMKIGWGGPLCFCGQRGCLEAYVSVQKIREELGRPVGTFTDIMQLLEEGHPQAKMLFEQVGRHLGFMLGNTLNLLNPTVIILGGELVTAAGWFKESMVQAIEEITIRPTRDTPIIYSDYNQNNCSMGAAALVFHHWIFHSG